MSSEEVSQSAGSTYRYLHLSPEELAQLSADERLQACLEVRQLLDLIRGVLYTPDSTLIDRAVTIDLLYTEAERLSRRQGAGAPSANSVYEGMQAYRAMATEPEPRSGAQEDQPSGPPTGVAAFAADTTIRSVFDPGNRIAHWSQFDRGGHFPAMEVPDLLVGDIQAFFRKLR